MAMSQTLSALLSKLHGTCKVSAGILQENLIHITLRPLCWRCSPPRYVFDVKFAGVTWIKM
jgi:hypothetical protein